MRGVKLVSLNIERSKHLDRVIPFLEREKPDIFCAMELAERDITRFEQVVGECRGFAPMMTHAAEAPDTQPAIIGTGIFSATPGTAEIVYYRGSEEGARSLPTKSVMSDINLIRFDFAHEGTGNRIVTTHFTWTPDGRASQQQRIDLAALFAYLDSCDEFVLCGDLNAPRGGEIFSQIAARYTDNIPAEYTGSIDVTLHRAGHLLSERMDTKMVDGLFTTPAYRVSDVHLSDGVSDHMAIVAHISRDA